MFSIFLKLFNLIKTPFRFLGFLSESTRKLVGFLYFFFVLLGLYLLCQIPWVQQKLEPLSRTAKNLSCIVKPFLRKPYVLGRMLLRKSKKVTKPVVFATEEWLEVPKDR